MQLPSPERACDSNQSSEHIQIDSTYSDNDVIEVGPSKTNGHSSRSSSCHPTVKVEVAEQE